MGDYRTLLDATIQHLETLRREGVRAIPISAETMRAMAQPRRPAPRPGSVGGLEVPASPAAGAPWPPASPASSLRPAAATVASPASVTVPGANAGAASPPAPGAALSPAAAEAAARRWSKAAAAPVPAAAARPLPPKLDPAAKAAALEDLRRAALACRQCAHLAAARKTVVFGVGDVHARLMFIGEAPGADEDAQGEPFVGRAGELLTRIILAMGLTREQVFIANILKCRPDTPGQSSGNRKPTSEEMSVCQPWLERQLDIIQPEVIVALGATAVEGLVGKASAAITRTRGQWLAYRGIPLMPTFHPAYLLRNQAPSEKRKVWEDMLAAMERLKLPISEKQRGFFLVKG